MLEKIQFFGNIFSTREPKVQKTQRMTLRSNSESEFYVSLIPTLYHPLCPLSPRDPGTRMRKSSSCHDGCVVSSKGPNLQL